MIKPRPNDPAALAYVRAVLADDQDAIQCLQATVPPDELTTGLAGLVVNLGRVSLDDDLGALDRWLTTCQQVAAVATAVGIDAGEA